MLGLDASQAWDTELAFAHLQALGEELAALSSELGETAAAIAEKAFAEIGREVNLGSPKQLQEVLFNELGMP